MPGSMFVLHDDRRLMEMKETPYNSKAVLQRRCFGSQYSLCHYCAKWHEGHGWSL
jgi:hypothetical protein